LNSAVIVFPASNCDRNAQSELKARASLKQICEKLLANAVIEQYEIEIAPR
jgi:phosphoribosylformylglycinamidine (FGAM) synthase PurS component